MGAPVIAWYFGFCGSVVVLGFVRVGVIIFQPNGLANKRKNPNRPISMPIITRYVDLICIDLMIDVCKKKSIIVDRWYDIFRSTKQLLFIW